MGSGAAPAASFSPRNPVQLPDSFTLTGSGFGHGVGMSQFGALAMAKAGMSASDIVTYYYQGTSVASVPDDISVVVSLEYRKKQISMRGESTQGDGTVQANLGGTVVVAQPGEHFVFEGQDGGVSVAKVAGDVREELGNFPSVNVTWSGLINVIDKGGRFGSEGHRYRYGSIDVLQIGRAHV